MQLNFKLQLETTCQLNWFLRRNYRSSPRGNHCANKAGLGDFQILQKTLAAMPSVWKVRKRRNLRVRKQRQKLAVCRRRSMECSLLEIPVFNHHWETRLNSTTISIIRILWLHKQFKSQFWSSNHPIWLELVASYKLAPRLFRKKVEGVRIHRKILNLILPLAWFWRTMTV